MMRIIFYTADPQLIEMVEGLGHESLLVSHEEEQILEWLDDVPEEDNVFLVIDFDEDQKKREKFSASLVKNEWIYRFIATSKLSLKDLKKHQKGKSAAHAYLRKPFTVGHLEEAVNEIEMAVYLELNPESDDSGFEPIHLGKASTPKKKTLPSSEDLSPENTEDRDISEFKVSSEVRKLIDKHSSNTSKALQNSEINKKIQAKFDFIFGEGVTSSELVSAKSGNMELPNWQDKTEPGKKIAIDSEASISIEEDEEDGLILELPDDEVSEESEINLDSEEDELVIDDEDEIDIEVNESQHLSEEGEISLDDDEELIIDDPEVSEEAVEEEIAEDSLEFGEEEENEVEISQLEAASEESEAVESETSQNDELEMQIPSEDDLELPNIDSQNLAPSKEVDMSVSKGKTGELSIDEESDAEDVGLEFGSSAPEEVEIEDENEGLEFASDEESEGLDLGEDDNSENAGIELGGIDLEDEGQGLELGDDNAGGIDLSDDSDSSALELGEDSEELVLGDDDSGIDLNSDEDAGFDLGTDGESEAEEEELVLGAEENEEILSEEDVEIGADDFDEGSGELNLAELSATDEEEIHSDDTGSFADDELFSEEDDHTDKTIVMQKGMPAFEEDEDAIDLSSDDEDIIDEKTGEFDDLDVDTGSDETDVTMIMSSKQIAKETETENLFEEEDSEDVEELEEEIASPATSGKKEKGVMTFSTQVDVAQTYVNEGDLVRLQATIRQLREDREKMLAEIKVLKSENAQLDQENLSLRAELDDAKVEVTISKKRHADEVDELKYRLKIGEEKRLMAEEKFRQAHKEIDRLEGRVRLDINQVKHREKELEAKLELVTMDSESQVKTRDMKILELKRKIDQLEFNMENVVIREQKSREDKIKLEERLQRMMKTLRGSIQLLEDDMTVEANRLSKNNDLKD